MAFVLLFAFVFVFCYGCVKQQRIRTAQRHTGQIAELLLLRRALEIAASANVAPVNVPEDQAPQA